MAPWLKPDGAQRVVGAPDRLLGPVHPRAPARKPRVGEDEIRRGAGDGVDHDALGRVALDLRASGGAGSGAARRRAVVEEAQRRGVVEARPGPRDEERAGKRPVVPVDGGVGPVVVAHEVRRRARRTRRQHEVTDPEQVEDR